MLAMIGLVGMLVLVIGLGVFLGLAPEPQRTRASAAERQAAAPARFFDPQPRMENVFQDGTALPLELLLSRLERHVRQEQAAVEGFVLEPSAQNLRRHTSSPLVN